MEEWKKKQREGHTRYSLSRCYTLTPLGARKLFDQRVREWKHEGKNTSEEGMEAWEIFVHFVHGFLHAIFPIFFFVVRENEKNGYFLYKRA